MSNTKQSLQDMQWLLHVTIKQTKESQRRLEEMKANYDGRIEELRTAIAGSEVAEPRSEPNELENWRKDLEEYKDRAGKMENSLERVQHDVDEAEKELRSVEGELKKLT